MPRYIPIIRYVPTQAQTKSTDDNRDIKGEVHSRMAIHFLYANKKFTQRYVTHLQRSL